MVARAAYFMSGENCFAVNEIDDTLHICSQNRQRSIRSTFLDVFELLNDCFNICRENESVMVGTQNTFTGCVNFIDTGSTTERFPWLFQARLNAREIFAGQQHTNQIRAASMCKQSVNESAPLRARENLCCCAYLLARCSVFGRRQRSRTMFSPRITRK